MINTNLPLILHHFQVMANYMSFSLASEGRITLTPSLRVIPCEYHHKWYTATNQILRATFHSQNVWCIFNHFYVIGPQSYRVWQNNANYTAITPFKVTDFGTNWKPICDFLLVINSNLSPILRRFHVMADYLSNFHNR